MIYIFIPAYIPVIFSNNVRIRGDLNPFYDKLRELGLTKDDYNLFIIPFNPLNKDHFKDINLINLLMTLSGIGLLFGEDYTQLFSPAAFMIALRNNGYKIGDFKTIGFCGKNSIAITSFYGTDTDGKIIQEIYENDVLISKKEVEA